MKKLLIFSLFSALFVSCLKEEDDKFSQSASERLEAAVAEAKTALQSAANGWHMEIYPAADCIYGGYNVFLKFNADGTVVAASENFAASQTATSYYTVEGESGAVLSFDTYNDIFHFYSSPSTGAEQGIGTANGGLEGDSDFVVMEASPEFIKLKGRKSGNYAYMYPLETSDWTTEMQAYIDAGGNMDVNCTTCTVDGVEYPVTRQSSLNNFTSRVFTIAYTPEGEDAEVQEIDAPYVCTKTGIRFYEPVTIGSKTVSEMTFKEDYYFETEDGSVRISGAAPIRSDNQFTIEISDLTFSSVTVSVTPTIDDEYYQWAVFPKSSIATMSDKAIMRALVDELNMYLEYGYGASTILSQLAFIGPSMGTFTDQLSPETEYVAAAFGLALLEDGSAFTATTDLFKKEFTSAEMPELDENYAAWLGTWEVTSTSSEVTQSPLTFTVDISVKIPNSSLNVNGWTISILRDYSDYPAVADWDAESGMITFANQQSLGADGDYTVTFVGRAPYQGSYTILTGDYIAMGGMLGADKTTATIVGNDLGSWQICGMEYFAVIGNSFYIYNPASGFTSRDFPVGPFSLRKVGTRAVAAQPQPQAHVLRAKSWKSATSVPVAGVATTVSAE